ncbi:MAG: hypothetical protein LCH68_08905 [Proteobacteria bacterium]|nr:hypothetical protein [Pseudomonadota bacterium]
MSAANRLLAVLVLVLLMQHSFAAAAHEDVLQKRTRVQVDNEAVARAYKVAIDKFVIELSQDLGRDGEMEDRLALLRNYQSIVYAEGNGFCISFSPFSLKGEVVFGGRQPSTALTRPALRWKRSCGASDEVDHKVS